MFAAPLSSMGSLDDIGVRIGMVCAVLSVGDLIGPPISGTIRVATGGYVAVGIYAGKFSF